MVYVESFTQDFYLKLQVEFEVGFRVKFCEDIHDAHCPGIGRFEDLQRKGTMVTIEQKI